MKKQPTASSVRPAKRRKTDPLPSLHEATRAAVIAAQEAAKSLRQQAPGTLEEAKAQGALTGFHPSDMDPCEPSAQTDEQAAGEIGRPFMGQPTVRQELDQLSEKIMQMAQEDFRRGRSDAPSGQFWPHNGKPITRHDAAILDLARIEFERRRLDEIANPPEAKPTVGCAPRKARSQGRASTQAPAGKAASDSSARGK